MRYVHTHRQGRLCGSGELPGANLTACLAEEPVADRHDQTTLFGDWQKRQRSKQTTLWMPPANERLNLDDAAVGQFHNWLIIDLKLLLRACLSQFGLELETIHSAGVHLGIE